MWVFCDTYTRILYGKDYYGFVFKRKLDFSIRKSANTISTVILTNSRISEKIYRITADSYLTVAHKDNNDNNNEKALLIPVQTIHLRCEFLTRFT